MPNSLVNAPISDGDLNEKTSDVVEEMYDTLMENWNTITSFSDIQDKMEKSDVYEDLAYMTSMLSSIFGNIQSNDMITDKVSAWKKAVAEYTDMVNSIFDGSFYQQQTDKEISPLRHVFDKIKSLIKAKKTKTEGGVSYSASDYAYVPDPEKPSTWKLRMAEGESGKITTAQLGRAAAAFSSGGFRGNKVELPSGEVASVKRKLRSAYKKLGVDSADIPDSIKEGSGMMFFKDKSGNMRWLAAYSNCYRDDDNPSEIISKESHRVFENLVDKGIVPAPELWHWHIPGSKWGTGDFVAWDEENGIAMAGGTIDPGHEKEAIALSKKDHIAVSHGMPKNLLQYDSKDDSVIVRHITKEVSDLPDWAAANKLTQFYLFEEESVMGIPDAKKDYLRSLGLTDDIIKEIEEGNSSKAKFAGDLGIESKEASTEETKSEVDPAGSAVAETKPTDPPASGTPEGDGNEKKEASAPDYATKEEVASATTQVVSPMLDAIKSLVAQVESLSNRLADLETVKSKELAETPVASIAAMIAKGLNLSAVGSNETKIDGRNTLSKSHPEETEGDKKTQVSTGNSVIDAVISGILSQ